MAKAALKPCARLGCGALVHFSTRFCERHASVFRKESDAKRDDATKRGYNYQWRIARQSFLRANPLCVHCMDKEHRVTMATDVDHMKPHRGDMGLFWDRDNWQPLCKACHSRKTVSEDGGFGRLAK